MCERDRCHSYQRRVDCYMSMKKWYFLSGIPSNQLQAYMWCGKIKHTHTTKWNDFRERSIILTENPNHN